MKPKILIAEDEPNILNLLKLSLSDTFDILEAENGVQALQIIKEQEENPDLILLDVMMPEMNGYEVCQELKQDEYTKDIIVVMLSAKGQVKERQIGLQIGADHYITKPFDPMALKERIKDIIKSKTEG